MKKTRKTYGVYNLVEWHALLKVGKATVKVAFIGGSITTQGVTPATFTTDNPIVQIAIEHSAEFAKGKIKLIRTSNLGGDVEIERNPVKPIVEVPKMETTVTPADNEVKNDGRTPEAIAQELVVETPAEETPAAVEDAPDPEPEATLEATPESPVEESSAEGEVQAMTEVEFSCNEDAKDYLEQNFGVARSKMHTRKEIIAMGRLHRVAISFE